MLNRERRQHVAATTVQHAVQEAARRRRVTKSRAATTIQSRVRGLLARAIVCQVRSTRRTATLRIQRLFRGHRGRRIFKSTASARAKAMIQASEMILAGLENGSYAATTVMDRITWVATALFVSRLRRCAAATVIQSVARRRQATKSVPMLRRHKARCAAATVIQSVARRHQVTKSVAMLRRHKAAIAQGYARHGFLARISALNPRQRHGAATTIQRHARGSLARDIVCRARLLQKQNEAAKTIQCYARGLAAHTLMRRAAALHVQRIFRGYWSRHFQKMSNMDKLILKWHPELYWERRRQRLENEAKMRELEAMRPAAALHIQRIYRGYWSRHFQKMSPSDRIKLEIRRDIVKSCREFYRATVRGLSESRGA